MAASHLPLGSWGFFMTFPKALWQAFSFVRLPFIFLFMQLKSKSIWRLTTGYLADIQEVQIC